MNLNNPNYVLVIVGILAIIVEIFLGVATGFDLLLVGIIFVISGGIGMATGNFTVAVVATCVLSALYVLIGRAIIKQKLHIETKSTNTDRLIQEKAIVVKDIQAGSTGQVKVDGEIWRATSEDSHNAGDRVIITGVSGITLTVQK